MLPNFIDSPIMQARQILSLSPTSPTQFHTSQTSSSNMDQLGGVPLNQITQHQKQSLLPDAGKNFIVKIISNLKTYFKHLQDILQIYVNIYGLNKKSGKLCES